MSDRLIRLICRDAAIKMTGVVTTDLVERMRQIHKTLPLATAALGRTLSAASMLGRELKDEHGSLTIQIHGDGPLGAITAVSDCDGNVRGYLQNPAAIVPLKQAGKLDVGAGVGAGYLMVSKDIGVGEPFNGMVELHNGEIAEDITKYLAESEQVPSAVSLGVLVDVEQKVIAAGGFMVQLMPGATDEDISRLEQNIAACPSMTTMLHSGLEIEEIAARVLEGFSFEILESVPIAYRCNCSEERVHRALISLGKEELIRLRDEKDEEMTVTCQFCDKVYTIGKDKLTRMIEHL